MARSKAKPFVLPKLVMGHIEVVGPDGEDGIPYDEAVIHLEGDEDSEIEIRCPGALKLAPLIVNAVNNHADLLEQVKLFERCIEYQIRVAKNAGDDEGARLQGFTLHLVRETIARTTTARPEMAVA